MRKRATYKSDETREMKRGEKNMTKGEQAMKKQGEVIDSPVDEAEREAGGPGWEDEGGGSSGSSNSLTFGQGVKLWSSPESQNRLIPTQRERQRGALALSDPSLPILLWSESVSEAYRSLQNQQDSSHICDQPAVTPSIPLMSDLRVCRN